MSDLIIPQNQEIIARLRQQAERVSAAVTVAKPTNAREITAAQDRIRELQHQLKQLPEQARTLKLAGKGREARDTLDVLEDVHVELGKAQIELARLEADRADAIRRAHQQASAGTNTITWEAMQLSEQLKRQADLDLATIRGLAGQIETPGSNYQNEATAAGKRLREAEARLKTLADGPVTSSPASKGPAVQVERAILLEF